MKRLVSAFVALILLVVIISTVSVSATVTTQTPPNGGWARIRYSYNGKYLDIPSEAFYDNGTQLQVWDYVYGNQNQIFSFYDTGDGWQISSHLTGKVVEVRNSSHDDCAQVAQWDKHNLACARWDIISNSDGTVSFRNKESGLYLNVRGGGDASNGTKIIQYHSDGTKAMKFYIEAMTYNDVLSATFNRDIQSSEIRWTEWSWSRNYVVSNLTHWSHQVNGKIYYPTPNQGLIFKSAEYLSPNTVANILKKNAYSDSIWNEIKNVLYGETTEFAVSKLIKRMGFKDIPGLGYAIGILQAIWDSRDHEKWDKFVDAAKIDPQGRCSGVIVYTYYSINSTYHIGPLNGATTAYGANYDITRAQSVVYKNWTGDNFKDVCILPVEVQKGQWWFYFK